jgi:alkyldihydroxyacetonephosphate synthase
VGSAASATGLLGAAPSTATRWDGWGDPGVVLEVPPGALGLLRETLGPATPPRDATLDEVLAGVPSSRLPPHPLLTDDPLARLRHARGQSLPDLIALRGGRVEVFPDGVAYPESDEAVRDLLAYASRAGARVIPYGGGTSVVGHVTPLPGDAPVLTLDVRRLNRLYEFDPISGLATFGAGVVGPELEAHLRARDHTLGHFPQSFELSTLGGWVATRSSGHYSLGYGRIERLFVGGRVETPGGRLELPIVPASATGPDLRELFLGSEGRLGVLTRATVRASQLPEREMHQALFFPDWDAGVAAARSMVQARLPLLMLRCSTPLETAITLALGGRPRLVAALERWLAWRGAGAERCLLLVGLAGRESVVAAGWAEVLRIAGRYHGVGSVLPIGRQWRRHRFRAPYLRDALWRLGYGVDTVETAVDWSRVPGLVAAVESALRGGLAAEGEPVQAYSHLSHLYGDGSSVYTTYFFRLGAGPDETLRRWRTLKAAASRAILAGGGTISHQHGVGLDHEPYLAQEKGGLGLVALRSLASALDPDGIMNPGKLFR